MHAPLAPPFEVRVPASTSNLGPGFDFLGLALDLTLFARVVGRTGGREHEVVRREGTASGWPRGGEDLVLRAFDAARERFGVPREPFAFEVGSAIPVARGLGSSGAAVAAGMLLAAALARREVGEGDLCALGLEIEGHPDNVCAALVGGCTLSVPLAGGRVRVVRQPLHPSLAYAVAWPAVGLPTAEARRVLPREVPFADAVENPRRLALLLEGLRTGDLELLAEGGQDRLHVRHRLPRIAGGAEALEAARAAGAALATISGSGSALIAIGPRASIADVASALARPLAGAERRVVEPVFGAPRVRRSEPGP